MLASPLRPKAASANQGRLGLICPPMLATTLLQPACGGRRIASRFCVGVTPEPRGVGDGKKDISS